MNNSHTTALLAAIQPTRAQLLAHPLYQHIKSINNLRTFTQHHVYAVWDFMTLLKALQRRLTCVTLPWKPEGNAETRYFINEIVTGEESDVDEQGNRCSHYELYLRAMFQLGVNTSYIEDFVHTIDALDYQKQIANSALPDSVQQFLRFTFDTAINAPTHVLAAVFTYGREDLIPDMFLQIVHELSQEHPNLLSIFRYYLERHIEVDGDEHSILGKKMVENLCGEDAKKWEEATAAAIQGLKMRHMLWDGILAAIQEQ